MPAGVPVDGKRRENEGSVERRDEAPGELLPICAAEGTGEAHRKLVTPRRRHAGGGQRMRETAPI